MGSLAGGMGLQRRASRVVDVVLRVTCGQCSWTDHHEFHGWKTEPGRRVGGAQRLGIPCRPIQARPRAGRAHWYKGDWSTIYHQAPTTPDATARAVRRKYRPPHTGHIEASSYVSEDGGPRLMRSVIAVHSMHGRAIHPTEKPLGIFLTRLSLMHARQAASSSIPSQAQAQHSTPPAAQAAGLSASKPTNGTANWPRGACRRPASSVVLPETQKTSFPPVKGGKV